MFTNPLGSPFGCRAIRLGSYKPDFSKPLPYYLECVSRSPQIKVTDHMFGMTFREVTGKWDHPGFGSASRKG